MPLVQRFAQVFGIVYVLVGVAGFILPLLLGETAAEVMGPFAGLLLGLFAVNWFHSVAHLAIGPSVWPSTGATRAPKPTPWRWG